MRVRKWSCWFACANFAEHEAEVRTLCLLSRVSSYSNPADAPSRGDNKRLLQLGFEDISAVTEIFLARVCASLKLKLGKIAGCTDYPKVKKIWSCTLLVRMAEWNSRVTMSYLHVWFACCKSSERICTSEEEGSGGIATKFFLQQPSIHPWHWHHQFSLNTGYSEIILIKSSSWNSFTESYPKPRWQGAQAIPKWKRSDPAPSLCERQNGNKRSVWIRTFKVCRNIIGAWTEIVAYYDNI